MANSVYLIKVNQDMAVKICLIVVWATRDNAGHDPCLPVAQTTNEKMDRDLCLRVIFSTKVRMNRTDLNLCLILRWCGALEGLVKTRNNISLGYFPSAWAELCSMIYTDLIGRN